MIKRLTRREALQSFLLGGVSASASLLLPDSVFAENQFPLTVLGYCWDDRRKQLVSQAMEVAHHRLSDPAVAQNAQQIANDNHMLTAELVAATAQDVYPKPPVYDKVLWCHLEALKNEPTKPRVVFVEWDGRNDPCAAARADTGMVSIRYLKNGQTRITGEFRIYVNMSLFATTNFSDPVFWGAVFAHEMLHNLGHLHELDFNHPWYPLRQMVIFTQAVYFNGKYQHGMRSPFLPAPRQAGRCSAIAL